VVATTSGGVAATLGYEDHEGARADEMFAAAARIARGAEVPVTVDAEAGYGMQPAEPARSAEDAQQSARASSRAHAASSWRPPRAVADGGRQPLAGSSILAGAPVWRFAHSSA
jgi:hypothetical protein